MGINDIGAAWKGRPRSTNIDDRTGLPPTQPQIDWLSAMFPGTTYAADVVRRAFLPVVSTEDSLAAASRASQQLQRDPVTAQHLPDPAYERRIANQVPRGSDYPDTASFMKAMSDWQAYNQSKSDEWVRRWDANAAPPVAPPKGAYNFVGGNASVPKQSGIPTAAQRKSTQTIVDDYNAQKAAGTLPPPRVMTPLPTNAYVGQYVQPGSQPLGPYAEPAYTLDEIYKGIIPRPASRLPPGLPGMPGSGSMPALDAVNDPRWSAGDLKPDGTYALSYGQDPMISPAIPPVVGMPKPPPLPRPRPPGPGGGFDLFKTIGDVANTATGYVVDGVNAAADMGGQAVQSAGTAGAQAAKTIQQTAPLMGLLRMFQPYNANSPYVFQDGWAVPRLPPPPPFNPGLKYGATQPQRQAAEGRRQALMSGYGSPAAQAQAQSGVYSSGTMATDWATDPNYRNPNALTARQLYG